jgi:hypothetical protein
MFAYLPAEATIRRSRPHFMTILNGIADGLLEERVELDVVRPFRTPLLRVQVGVGNDRASHQSL